jgi:hypothetical protein
LHKQNALEKENQKLQNELEKLKENELKVLDYEKTIKSLSDRLEKLLTL